MPLLPKNKNPRLSRIFADKLPARANFRSQAAGGQRVESDAPHWISASMSSYPPPPPSTTDSSAAPTSDPAQQRADDDSLQGHAQQVHHAQFTSDSAAAAAAAAAAVAAAHHGLQALQAAVAAPTPGQSLSPVTPQHPALADASYLGVNVAGAPVVGASPVPNSKATRLRRACDMCSQRKVKVCTVLAVTACK